MQQVAAAPAAASAGAGRGRGWMAQGHVQAAAVNVVAVRRGLQSVTAQSVAVPRELRPFGDELCAAVVAALRLLRGDEEAQCHGCAAVANLLGLED